MHPPTALFLTSLLALFSPSFSAPQDTAAAPLAPRSCVVPAIAFTTIDKPFSLSALVLNPGSIPFAVLLPQPSAQTATQPYISRSKIAPPLFRLTNGNLTTGGANYLKFPGYFGPTIAIFPPVLQPLLFGGGETDHPNFFAGYACDAEGKQYLELRTFERKAFLDPLSSRGKKRSRKKIPPICKQTFLFFDTRLIRLSSIRREQARRGSKDLWKARSVPRLVFTVSSLSRLDDD